LTRRARAEGAAARAERRAAARAVGGAEDRGAAARAFGGAADRAAVPLVSRFAPAPFFRFFMQMNA